MANLLSQVRVFVSCTLLAVGITCCFWNRFAVSSFIIAWIGTAIFGRKQQLQLLDASLQHENISGKGDLLSERRAHLSRRLEQAQQCKDKYVADMAAIRPDLRACISEFIYRTPKHRSRHPLIIGAAPGDSATRSVYTAIHRQSIKSTHFNMYNKGAAGHDSKEGKVPYSCLKNFFHICRDSQFYTNFNWSCIDEWEAVHDTPVGNLWYDLWLTHPESKVVMSYRPPEKWAKDRMNSTNGTGFAYILRASCESQRMQDFTIEQHIAAYEANLNLMKCIVPKQNLLILHLFEGMPSSKALWGVLCKPSWMHCKGKQRNFPGLGRRDAGVHWR